MARGRTVAIAGASGLVGCAAVAAFAKAGWSVVALSRRRPALEGADFRHVPVDLTDAASCAHSLAALPGITHLVFAALHEQPDLVSGWRDRGQMEVNLAMLRHLLDPLAATGNLEHVSLLQGTKAYGVHVRPFASPAKEGWPRHPHQNFYWLQEDHLRAMAAASGFGFTIFRPQVVFGTAIGVAMNILPALGAYAALRREEGRPFSDPGGPGYLLEATDTDLQARALLWAADATAAKGQTFNVTNGDVFAWPTVWPVLAEAFGVDVGDDEPGSLARYLDDNAGRWPTLAQRHGLAEPALDRLVGLSHRYADFCMAVGSVRPPAPVLVSTIKIRQAGFFDCLDTEGMFVRQIAQLRARRILP